MINTDDREDFPKWWASLSEEEKNKIGKLQIGDHLGDSRFLTAQEWRWIGLAQWWDARVEDGEAGNILMRLHDDNGARPYVLSLQEFRQPGHMASFHHPDDPGSELKQPFSSEQIWYINAATRLH